jgi:hypothetical protein
MGTRMTKTTIELSDDLARKAKALAARRGTTLRALIEQALRNSLREERSSTQFELQDASVGGKGLQPEFVRGGWPRIRDAIYSGDGS